MGKSTTKQVENQPNLGNLDNIFFFFFLNQNISLNLICVYLKKNTSRVQFYFCPLFLQEGFRRSS